MGTGEGGSNLAFESRMREAANQRKDHSKSAFKALASFENVIVLTIPKFFPSIVPSSLNIETEMTED